MKQLNTSEKIDRPKSEVAANPSVENSIEKSVETLMSPSPALGRAVTLLDVAEQVGVSKAAVSSVLSNSNSGIRVSEATRQRIIEAARALDYHPNILARSLRRLKTNIIGFHSEQGQMFDPLYPFFGHILRGLLQGCEDNEKNFLIHGAFGKRSQEDIFLELLNGQIDGLVLYARDVTPLVQRLIESRLPVVTVADEVPGLPSVTVDNEQGGRILARYLAQKGYKNAYYRVTEPVLPSSIATRLRGFQDEALLHGMKVTVYESGSAGAGERDEAVLRLGKNRPDVIATFGDFSADNLVSFCEEQGFRVPQDIAVAGFDGFTSAFRTAYRLTTVRAPWDEVARTAVSHLVAQCNGQEVPIHTLLPVELIEGETA